MSIQVQSYSAELNAVIDSSAYDINGNNTVQTFLNKLAKIGGFAAIFARSGSSSAKSSTHICLSSKIIYKIEVMVDPDVWKDQDKVSND